jgi:hypothetical protein
MTIDELKDEYEGIEDLDGFDELCTHELDRVPDYLDMYSCRRCEMAMEIKVMSSTGKAWDISFMEPDKMAGWFKGTRPKVCP